MKGYWTNGLEMPCGWAEMACNIGDGTAIRIFPDGGEIVTNESDINQILCDILVDKPLTRKFKRRLIRQYPSCQS